MNIGLIIFVVSVVISLISAINDKNYKKRQQNQPKSSQPRSCLLYTSDAADE